MFSSYEKIFIRHTNPDRKTELSHKSQYIHQKGVSDSVPVVDILAAISYIAGKGRQ